MTNTVIIKCRKCEQKLRVPSDKGILEITCPRCKSSFLHQTNTVSQTTKANVTFQDELRSMHTPPKSTYYSDEQVYLLMLQEMYEHCVKGAIRTQYSQNRANRVQAKFRLDGYYKDFNRGDDVSGYRKDSDVYDFWIDDYEGWRAKLYFKPLYKMETSGGSISTSRKRFVLTPLGQRVYNDLKRMANADGVTMHEPVCTYYTEYNSFGSKKLYTCNQKLNEYFYGKDPGHYTYNSGHNIEIPVSITI